jgi:hypothetical protein
LAIGTEHPQSLRFKLVYQAKAQRQFRTDNREIDAFLPSKREQPGNILRRERNKFREFSDASVPWRAIYTGHAPALTNFPHQGVLTPAAADD